MAKILFSDIDGTLAYKECLLDGVQISGENVFIHREIQSLLAEIKKKIPVILISGRRMSSYLRVKKFIPHSAAILEHGGLICNDELIFSKWKKVLGSDYFREEGRLWKFANKLRKKGFYIDRKGREVSFRIQLTESNKILPISLRREVARSLPDWLRAINNEKMMDIIPTSSGKLNAASFYLREKKIDINDAIFIGNDESDLELLGVVGKAIISGNASKKIIPAIKAERKDVFLADSGHKGIIKTLEEIKKKLID